MRERFGPAASQYPDSSKDADPHGVGRLTVHGDDDIHLAAAGETPWKAQIDLIDADELGLCSREQNLGGLASDRCRDRLGTAEPDAGAKQDASNRTLTQWVDLRPARWIAAGVRWMWMSASALSGTDGRPGRGSGRPRSDASPGWEASGIPSSISISPRVS